MANVFGGADALVFNFPTSSLRVVAIDGEPWFVASDVCAALGVQNVSQAVGRLDEDERAMFNIGPGGECHIVNESGLYSLILGSRKPEAKRFKRWVTGEVLPAIRRTGRYEGAAPAGDSPMLTSLMGQVGELQAQVAQRDAAIAVHTTQVIALQAKLIGQQERELKSLRKLDAVQGRMGRHEATAAIIDMERRGEPRALIALRTGRNHNHIRQVLHKARAAGMLPPLAEGDFHPNTPAPERAARAAAAAQKQLDLGAGHA